MFPQLTCDTEISPCTHSFTHGRAVHSSPSRRTPLTPFLVCSFLDSHSFFLIYIYILLIMLLQLSHFPPSLRSTLPTPHPHSPLVHVHVS